MKPATEERVAHTPTHIELPWRFDGRWIIALEPFTKHIAMLGTMDMTPETQEANAAFIVTACNAHEALVDALRAVEAVLSATFKSQSSIQAMSADEYGEALKAYNQAKSALKLAGQ